MRSWPPARRKGRPVLIAALWHGEALDVATESKVLSEFASLLTTADHKRRMDMLLYRGRIEQAARFSDLGKAQSLYRAWVAMARKAGNADALIAAVDPSWRKDPAYLFVRIEQLRKKEEYRKAAALLADLPRDKDLLVDPGEWWTEQRIISRGLLDLGDYRGAYRVAANHVASEASDVVDAEFHAGWYALRGLNDGATAARHFSESEGLQPPDLRFARLLLARTGRRGRWTGRRQGLFRPRRQPDRHLLRPACRRPAEPRDARRALPEPQHRGPRTIRSARSRARDQPARAGRPWLARRQPVPRAGRPADEPRRAGAAFGPGGEDRSHSLALQVGKLAFGRGIDVAALAFRLASFRRAPILPAPARRWPMPSPRQESAFNPAAISPANARGLLQILPTTARGVAGRHGLSYSQERLTTDAGYNATLGAHYLGEQISDFGGSYVLTFIAYNAGPRRVPEWIARYGDPRGKSIDEVVDWIERIPFAETRGYVQRVMENYQVYKARLGQRPDIVDDLTVGRQAS